MDTLMKVRRGECITELTREIVSSADTAYLTVELKDRHLDKVTLFVTFAFIET